MGIGTDVNKTSNTDEDTEETLPIENPLKRKETCTVVEDNDEDLELEYNNNEHFVIKKPKKKIFKKDIDKNNVNLFDKNKVTFKNKNAEDEEISGKKKKIKKKKPVMIA